MILEYIIFMLMYTIGYMGSYVVLLTGDIITGLSSLFVVTIILLSFFGESWKGPHIESTAYVGKD